MEKINNLKTYTSLLALDKSESAIVVKINTNDVQKLRKLTAFGIMPGSKISIIQKYPAVVIQVGYTQLAMDNDIAAEIMIEK